MEEVEELPVEEIPSEEGSTPADVEALVNKALEENDIEDTDDNTDSSEE